MSFQKIDIEHDIRPEEKHCILIVGFTEEEQNQITNFAATEGIPEVINVPKEQLGNKVGAFLEGANEEKEFTGAIVAKAIIMSGFTQKEVHSFVENFKSLGLTRPLFAMVTPTSSTWPVGKLIKELAMERMLMAKQKGRPKHR